MINEQVKHAAYIVKAAAERQARTVEPSQEAEDAWVDTIVKLAVLREQFLKECTPGYYNNEGMPEAMTAKNSSYGAGPVAFTKVLEAWRAEGELKGLELSAG
jgi:cyclohexanone monooxygenase